MNVALYARVSTGDQSVEVQLRELREIAQQRRWVVVAEFTDVMSGSKAARPGLDAMLAAARAGKFSAIVAVKLDRFARSLANFSQLVTDLAKMKVALVCTSQGIDTSNENPCGEMIRGILSVIAEFERSLIRERTRAGLAAARARGVNLGRPSTKMPSGPDRIAVLDAWRSAHAGKSYRVLGEMLGGVSPATAMRFAKANPAVFEEAP